VGFVESSPVALNGNFTPRDGFHPIDRPHGMENATSLLRKLALWAFNWRTTSEHTFDDVNFEQSNREHSDAPDGTTNAEKPIEPKVLTNYLNNGFLWATVPLRQRSSSKCFVMLPVLFCC
jgi:hypothetical protein